MSVKGADHPVIAFRPCNGDGAKGMSELNRDYGSTSNGRNPFSLRRCEAKRLHAEGSHEPYESRGSRTDMWGTGGEIPPVYPAMNPFLFLQRSFIS